MPILTLAFANYYVIVLAVGKHCVSACAQFKIFVVKFGSTCENKTDLDEKQIFHYKLSKKLSEALTVELELDVTVCAQLKIFTHKNSFTWLNFTKTLYLGPITCHRLMLKGNFFVSLEKGQKLKIQ